MSRYCCLFNHYNSNETINTYVFGILDFFSGIGCETILISNSPVKDEHGKEQLQKRFKGTYLERENIGYDFAAWQYAINQNLIPDDTEYLFLVNDSAFGPLFDLNETVQKMIADERIDFWGFTENYEVQWHLQSYFLCFKRKVFESAVFKEFFKQNFALNDKNAIISKGEILLSQSLKNAGFVGKSVIESSNLQKNFSHASIHKNPVIYFGDILIRKYKFPFLKKEFVIKNPANIYIPGGVLKMVNDHTTYPVHYITEALINKLKVEKINTSGTPLIDVFCHLYYLESIYSFLSDLGGLKGYNCRFFFNLSESLYSDPYVINILLQSFENCLIIQATNVGKDIGGKLALIDLSLKLKSQSNFSVLLHDKHSPHSSLGTIWRDKLFQIIKKDNIQKILNRFDKNDKLAIVSSKEFIVNEYNSATKQFDCTCNEILKEFIKAYQLHNKNYDFVGGTMFWIRSEVIRTFFLQHDPMKIRAELEKGNVLDTNQGTKTHAWERMLSWIASDQGYTIGSIHE